MAKNPLVFICFFLLSLTSTIVESKSTSSSSFIKASCKVTQYPTLCERTLSPYTATVKQNPRELAQTALRVGLSRAQTAKRLATKLTKSKGLKGNEYINNVLKDCSGQMSDSMDRIKQSRLELKLMASKVLTTQEYLWSISNVQTWVSAALTDQTSCLDGLSDWVVLNRGAVLKAQIMNRIVDAQQTTSNALALINQLAVKP
ncbi:pectinesterase inhibitor 9-like [Impatiens glandulifera]|uniref:pectinesterase inhibitor 9-like n=1 Tax=Impatiens glandulifera TaxID=253017 RepID=UPI001FB13A41|nr:pectinesterase inhibitor 9-like [Impatiens glandulifera]